MNSGLANCAQSLTQSVFKMTNVMKIRAMRTNSSSLSDTQTESPRNSHNAFKSPFLWSTNLCPIFIECKESGLMVGKWFHTFFHGDFSRKAAFSSLTTRRYDLSTAVFQTPLKKSQHFVHFSRGVDVPVDSYTQWVEHGIWWEEDWS